MAASNRHSAARWTLAASRAAGSWLQHRMYIVGGDWGGKGGGAVSNLHMNTDRHGLKKWMDQVLHSCVLRLIPPVNAALLNWGVGGQVSQTWGRPQPRTKANVHRVIVRFHPSPPARQRPLQPKSHYSHKALRPLPPEPAWRSPLYDHTWGTGGGGGSQSLLSTK